MTSPHARRLAAVQRKLDAARRRADDTIDAAAREFLTVQAARAAEEAAGLFDDEGRPVAPEIDRPPSEGMIRARPT